MKRHFKGILISLFLVGIFILGMVSLESLFATQTISDTKDNSLWIKYIDVGQGDATLIQCDGHYMLIDGGPATASSAIYSILKANKIDKIDYMIATHPDADHIGGLSGALNYAEVGKCLCPVTEYESKTFRSLVKYLKNRKASIEVPKVGAVYKLGSATVTILGPIEVTDETNNSSIVVKLDYGSNSFLFMGDAETEEEQQILQRWKNIECDVLKIGHHGSGSSTSDKLIKSSKPRYAIISVGKDNTYGHPMQSVLERLNKAKVEIYRTDLQGDIVVVSDGKNIAITTQKNEVPVMIPEDESGQVNNETTYVLNTRSRKFHSPTCKSVSDMSAKNRQDVSLTRDEIMADGYEPCKRCNP